MDDRVMQFRVGVVVLATGIITAILIVLFGRLPALVRGSYPVYVNFQDAPGIAPETPVRKSGILIGRVTKTELQPDGSVLASVTIYDDVTLRERDMFRINQGLLGDATLQVVQRPGTGLSDAPIGSGAYMQGGVSPDLIKFVESLQYSLGDTTTALSHAGEEVAILARNVNTLIGNNSEQFGRMVRKSEAALDSFQRAMASIDELVSDEQTKADLKAGLKEFPSLLKETRSAVAGMQETMELARITLKDVQGFTKPLAERGEDIVMNLNNGVGHLDELLKQLAQFSTKLNSSEGSMSQLLNNPELYQNLNSAARNVNELTREMQPVIRDAKVFSDKIARHPEVFTRGIIQPSSGIKGPSPIPSLRREMDQVPDYYTEPRFDH